MYLTRSRTFADWTLSHVRMLDAMAERCQGLNLVYVAECPVEFVEEAIRRGTEPGAVSRPMLEREIKHEDERSALSPCSG